MDNKIYKPSAFRKTFNIISLVLNSIHMGLAITYFSLMLFIYLMAEFVILLFQSGDASEFLWWLFWSILYLIPAITVLTLSIISTVKCFKYGYKKTLEMVSYIASIIFCLIDVAAAIICVNELGGLGVGSCVAAFLSIILFIVAIIALIIDKKK